VNGAWFVKIGGKRLDTKETKDAPLRPAARGKLRYNSGYEGDEEKPSGKGLREAQRAKDAEKSAE
jgi:hypothetical protein